MSGRRAAAIGLRARSGRAIAVALGGPWQAPSVLDRRELVFCGPDERQPYHPVMELPWAKAEAAVRKVAVAIEAAAAAALRELLRDLQASGSEVKAVGIVGAGRRDLARIGNVHIRAHAAEGVFFRAVLEAAAAANGLRSVVYPERGLEEAGAAALGRPLAEVPRRLQELGRTVGPPWRADEKAAALAAWAVLASA